MTRAIMEYDMHRLRGVKNRGELTPGLEQKWKYDDFGFISAATPIPHGNPSVRQIMLAREAEE